LGVNILVIDYNSNYNYLPITQKSIFNRSTKDFFKTIRYFNIGVILYLNINKKNFILKKFLNFNLINISLSDKTSQKIFDFNVGISNNPLYVYIIYITILNFYLKSFFKNNILNTMAKHYLFSNVLIYTIDILIFGTFLTYVIYFFTYINQYQNLIKHDTFYNLLKLMLLVALGLSYIFFIFFLYLFYTYYITVSNYALFSFYKLVPSIYLNFFFIWFEFSIDFFGIILLLLGYFVGILSLLSLDNRIF
jgi:hypothetical protein